MTESYKAPTCETHGHLWGALDKCVMCGAQKPMTATTQQAALTDAELEEAIKPVRKVVNPSKKAQIIRAQLAFALGDKADAMPDYVWTLVDIAVQCGIDTKGVRDE